MSSEGGPAPPGAGPPGPAQGAAAPQGWQAIRDEVMQRIRQRVYLPGALIPNEAELAAEFGCARATVNRALRDLADAGFLDRRRKAGTRVMAEPVRKATLEIPLIRREIERTGAAYSLVLLSRALLPPPERVRAALGVSDEPMLHVETLHRAGDRPFMFETRWIDLRTVPGIASVDLTQVNPNEWLVRNAPYTTGRMQFRAEAAGPDAAVLDCAESDSVLRIERRTWLGELPITMTLQTYAPGHGFTMEL